MTKREAVHQQVCDRSPPLIAMRLECGSGREVHKKGRKSCPERPESGAPQTERFRAPEVLQEMEAQMPDSKKPISNKRASGSDKAVHPSKEGGSQQQKAQEWGGGSKASKGSVTSADKRNENSSAKGR
jgi:hypothetical protein